MDFRVCWVDNGLLKSQSIYFPVYIQNYTMKTISCHMRVVVRILVKDPGGQWFESQARCVNINLFS